MSKESVAARALLAHFNNQLAGRLVRRLLKNENKEAWQRLSDAVFDLIPTAAKEKLWFRVVQYVETEGARYIASEAFQKRAKALLDANTGRWLPQAEEQVIKEQVFNHVQRFIKAYDVTQYLKDGSGRFKALYDEETRRLAHAKAFESMAQVKLTAASDFEATVAAEVVKQLERIEAAKKQARKR